MFTPGDLVLCIGTLDGKTTLAEALHIEGLLLVISSTNEGGVTVLTHDQTLQTFGTHVFQRVDGSRFNDYSVFIPPVW